MYIEPPVILDESIPVIEWARRMMDSQHSVTSIFSLLLNDKLSKYWNKDEELQEVREIFSKYSPSRDNVLLAIQLNAYRKKNDFKEGQIVTNGDLVGFAYELDYEQRIFDLHSQKEPSLTNCIGTFDIDDFRKV